MSDYGVEIVKNGQISHPETKLSYHPKSVEIWIPEHHIDLEIEIEEVLNWLNEWGELYEE